ncbi:MAG TPA: hypothetical protein VES21_09880 [Nocardioidaceae bacterium]|nr:hypothetical protein [Nocardioidaceae bacterium]
MSYHPGSDHGHVSQPSPSSDVDPTGIPRAGSGPERFVLLVGLLVALLALIVSLGWIVFNRLAAG